MGKKNFRQTTFELTKKECTHEYQDITRLIELIECNRVTKVSLDIETTPIIGQTEALDPWNGKIRLLGMYCKAGFFFCDVFRQFELVKIFLELCQRKRIIVIAHNAWFEGTWFRYHFGVEELNLRCTLLLQRIATTGQKLPADLHSVCKYYEIAINLFGENKKELQLSAFGGYITDEQIEYVLSDAKKAWDIFHKGIEKFPWPLSSYYDECQNLLFFIEMGVNGLPVNEELAVSILYKIQENMTRIERELGYGPGSRLALEKLFIRLGFKERDEHQTVFDYIQTSKLEYSSLDKIDKHFLGIEALHEAVEESKQAFDDTVLLIAEAKFKDKAPWRKIRAYRRLQWSKGYLKGILKRVFNGRVKPRILPISQSGYRVSVNNPNLANSIKEIDLLKELGIQAARIIFAEEGMLSTDGPAMHLRALAQLSRDPNLIKAINAGDIHSFNAASIGRMSGKDWTFDFVGKVKNDKTHPLYSDIIKYRDGAKEFIYMWLNGGQAEKAVVTLATGKAAYRSDVPEMQRWIDATDQTYVCATALKSLLADGPIKNAERRLKILRSKFGLSAETYLRYLQFVVDDNHILNANGKYVRLSTLPYNARIIAPWMSFERVAVTTCARRVFEIRKSIGYTFSSWQHDEFIGRSIDPILASTKIEEICLDVFRAQAGATKYFKDGDIDSPNRTKQGFPLGDFSALKMRIKNLTEK